MCALARRLFIARRRGTDAHAVELAAGLGGFRGVGETLNKAAKLGDGGLAFLDLEERHALVQMGDGDLGLPGYWLRTWS